MGPTSGDGSDGNVPPDVLAAVARAAALDAGNLSADLLGDFLEVLSSAVMLGVPLTRRQLNAYRRFGGEAAGSGVALRALLDLYLSSAWRLWRELPAITAARADPRAVVSAGEVMLKAVDDAVAELAEGYQLARRALVRAQESARREFVDDLLTGGADVAGMTRRAAEFGLDLSGPHAVLVVASARPFSDGTPIIGTVERAVQGSKGDAEVLVASKAGRLVVVFSAPDRDAVGHVVDAVSLILGPRPSDGDRVDLRRETARTQWQIGVGRSAVGAAGVVSSHREASDALDLADRISLDMRVVEARDLLIYHVLLRDRAAIDDLVSTLLTPLLAARGGAAPLLETLEAYFGAGGNTAHTARSMHLSVRAVTYRLARAAELTGSDLEDPTERFALHAAVLGAKLLGWPEKPLN